MSLTRADQRWLECLDRAIVMLERVPEFTMPETFISVAEQLYRAMPANRSSDRAPLHQADA